LKCYVHQNVDAVGVCSSCGRGVCNVCVVRLGGRLYCKEDADRLFDSSRSSVVAKPPRSRGVGVVLGSIFAYTLGSISAVISFAILFQAIISGASKGVSFFAGLFGQDLSFLGALQQYPSGELIGIGAGVLFLGSFGIAAGYYMWKPTKIGAVLSIIFGILGLVGGFELNSISIMPLIVDAFFILSGLTVAMAFLGFVQLTRASEKPVRTVQRAGSFAPA
jgi:hypothetical protein